MARAKSLALDVSMNGQLVGQYIRASSGRMEFRYAETWLQQKNAIALSLSLPLQERPWIGDQVNAVFENLLPDNAEFGASSRNEAGRVARMPFHSWPAWDAIA